MTPKISFLTPLLQILAVVSSLAPCSASPLVPFEATPPRNKSQLQANQTPVIQKPKGPTSWLIVFKYYNPVLNRDPKNISELLVNSVSVLKIAAASQQIIQLKQKAVEIWRVNGEAYTSDLGSDVAFPVSDEVSPDSPSPEEIDWAALEEFDWLTPELFKGEVSLGGQPTLIYAELPPLPPPAGDAKQSPPKKWPAGPLGMPLQPGIKVAAVDKATLLPKALQVGDIFSTYTFSKPAQTKLEIPQKVKIFLQNEAEGGGPK